MIKEYVTVTTLKLDINRVGEEGWELVSIVGDFTGRDGRATAFFKQPK
jgi:hypothetical protein